MEHAHRTALTETQDDLRIENQNFLGVAKDIYVSDICVDFVVKSRKCVINGERTGDETLWGLKKGRMLNTEVVSFFLFSFVKRVQVLLKEDKGVGFMSYVLFSTA
ncbi:hypothetical protein AK88_00297 [Plasmodium fragile]|uniref:Uncharacterized protein n=1 Tax=Plasmodium fragile TaxID=5857 RepID=A0A0D9QT51_PLAFR|nr:uncharacterized protein AK88_00297 [Plasmodium fragile]KJP90128.1 hypothetical protein AK88_00297 [Plasmodium fragile]